MKKLLKTAKYLLIGLYLMCGVVLAVFLLPKSGWRALNVATGSMAPAIPQGSLVVVRNVPYSQIRSNDVITYLNPTNTRQTITHRVVKHEKIAGLPGFLTKGDANQETDAAILGGNVVGKVIWHSAGLGYLLNFLKNPIFIFLLVGIPGLLIIIDEFKRLVKVLTDAEVAKKVQGRLISNPIENKKPVPNQSSTHPNIKRRGLVHLSFVLALMLIGTTKAQLFSSATLTNNTITTAGDGGSSGNTCSASSNISITDTGPGSVNNVSVTNSCNVSTSSTNVINISNSTTQSASTGNASTTGNTISSSPSSGTSANESDTSIEVEVSNY